MIPSVSTIIHIVCTVHTVYPWNLEPITEYEKQQREEEEKKSTTTYFLVGRGRKNVRLITVLHCTVLSLPLLLLSILPGCNMLCCAPFFWNSICSVCYIHLSLCILLRLIHFQFRFFTLIHRFLVCLSLSRSRSRSLSLFYSICALLILLRS